MSHPVGANTRGPAGAHPLNNDEHRRRGAWWWLIAFIALLLIALLIVLLVRRFGGDDNNAATAKTVPSISASASASTSTSTDTTAITSSPMAPAPNVTSAGAAIADAACVEPSLTVSPKTALVGQTITIIGRHFSGCRAASNSAAPMRTLPVAIGVAGASTISKAVATARTSANGSFRVSFPFPADPAGRMSLTLTASANDTRTTLAYATSAGVVYAAPASKAGGMPTAVPAGTGGQEASTAHDTVGAHLALLTGGLLLTAGGAIALRRQRRLMR